MEGSSLNGLLKSLRNLVTFKRCQYCGKLMWLYNRNLTTHCSADCLYQDIYKEKFKKSENLYKDITLLLDKLNDLCMEISQVMKKYTEE